LILGLRDFARSAFPPVFRRLALASLALVCLAAFTGCNPRHDPAAEQFGPLLPELPPELHAALDTYRAEGPKGWAFTQTTSGEGRDRVERYDPRARGAARWTLLLENGVPPTEAEQQRYRDTRPPFDSAAGLAGQFDRHRAALISEDVEAATRTYEFALKPASETDTAAAHMRARVTLHRPTGSIVRVELFNFRSFKPATSLTIHEARTLLVYAPSDGERPALPLESSMLIRGERFWFRAFEQSLRSVFSDHEDRRRRD
jgi:hypothetical protein